MGTNVRQNIVTNGLVLYLDAGNRMSYTSGSTTWSDLSGNGNNGTLTVSGSGATSASFDPSNQGNIKFNGTNNYVIMGANSILDLSGQFTFSVWFKFNTLASGNMLLARNRGGNFAFTFYQFSSGRPRLLLQNGSTGVDATSTNTYSIGNIYNLTTVLTSTQIIHYINGSLDTITSSGGLLPNYSGAAYTWTLGANPIDAPIFGDQNQYITSIYNRALSAQEVNQNYNATKTRFGLT
jgi:hypothetical protein